MPLRACAPALVATFAAMLATSVDAGPASLLGEGHFGGGGGPLIQRAAPLVEVRQEMPESAFIEVDRDAEDAAPQHSGSSLFAGQVAGSFFEPLPPRDRTRRGYRDIGQSAIMALGPDASAVERLRHLIGLAEAGAKGYDAINYGARRLTPLPPTSMTLGEIYAWIAETPGQPHAIGRYQFIPSTLKRLAKQIGAGEHERFSPRLQDRLADELFAEAGFAAYRDGLMGRTQFMNNLAKIWAGLPNSSGRSHYHGYAGNKATMTWARFEAEVAQMFPS